MATETITLSTDGNTFPSAPMRALRHMWTFLQPWHRRALALILLVATFCDFFALQRNGYANEYYAAAVKSMLESWHNFFFVSFDPGGFVTVDKPPLGFWIQAASAKIFGFSGFSILLPEALAGVLSVAVLYVLVRRLFGRVAGLLAALALAVTPISVVTNRNNTIDSLLVLTSLLAAYAVSRAIERGSLRWLLLCAVLVGLGFNIKMLEAYLVVPAFAALYLFAAPQRWRIRFAHLAIAGLLMLTISLSWVTIVDLTPAANRPYVGSSSTNSELELALGYNGIQRLTGTLFQFSTAARTSTTSSATTTTPAGGTGGPGGVSENGEPGVFRLVDAELGGQTSWLLSLGLLGLLASGWSLRPRRLAMDFAERRRIAHDSLEARSPIHLTARQGAWVLWGLWTVTEAVFFSIAGFFHTYYLSMLAPGVAALAGIGVVELWRDYRRPGWRGWLLPLALVVTAVVQGVILAPYATYSRWLTPLVVIVALAAAAALAWHRNTQQRLARAEEAREMEEYTPFVDAAQTPMTLTGRLRHWSSGATLAAILGVAVLFVGPITWVGVSLANGANSALPHAGPTTTLAIAGGGNASRFGSRPAGAPPFANGSGSFPPGGFAGAGGFPGGSSAVGGNAQQRAGGGASGPSGQSADTALIAYLEANQGTTRYLVATTNAGSAEPFILATGKPVMALGGFSGNDPILTTAQLQQLIQEGQVRYFLVSGNGGFGGQGGPAGSGGSTTGTAALTQWVTNSCTAVSASAYSGASSASSTGGFGGATHLYDCATIK